MKFNQIHNTFRQGLSEIMRPTRQLVTMALLGISAFGSQEAKANTNNGTPVKSRAVSARGEAANSYMIYNYGEQYRPGSNTRLDSVVRTVKTADNLYVALNKVMGEPLSQRDAYVRLITNDAEYKANVFKNAYSTVRQQFMGVNTGTASGDIQLIDPLKRIDISDVFRAGRRHPKLGVTRDHNGTDLRVSNLQGVGTPVYAVGDLQFTETGTDRSGVNFTKFILLKDGQPTGYGVEYLHVKKIDKKKCPPGTIFKQGEVVTTVGPTDAVSTGPHLEYRVTNVNVNTNERTGFVNTTTLLKNGNVLEAKGSSKPSPLLEKVPAYVVDFIRQDEEGAKLASLAKLIESEYKAGKIDEKTYQARVAGYREVDRLVKREAYTTFTASADMHIKMTGQAMNTYRHVGATSPKTHAENVMQSKDVQQDYASFEAIHQSLQENRSDLQQSGDLYAVAQVNELPMDKDMPTQANVFVVKQMRENSKQVVTQPVYAATPSAAAPNFTATVSAYAPVFRSA